MKKIKQLSLAGLLLVLAFSSCTTEKRVYMPGYHVSWNASKHNSNGQKSVNQSYEKEKKLSATLEPSKDNESVNISTTPEDNITASIDQKQIIVHQKKQVRVFSSRQTSSNHQKKAKLAREIKTFKSNSNKSDDGGGGKINGMALAGFICSLVGLLLLVTSGFPFMLGILGIIFSTIGMKRIKDGKGKGKAFAIAGLILGILDVILFILLVFILAALVFALL